MTKTRSIRSLSTGAISFTAATAMTSAAALAACGASATLAGLSSIVGPPSITATESSTDQALELIRKRREEASGACPAGFTRSGGNCVPIGGAPAPQQIAAAQPAPAPAAPPPVAVSTTTTTSQAPAAAAPAAAPAAATPRPKRVAAARAAQPAAQAAQPAPTQMAAAQRAPVAYSRGSIKDSGYDVPMPGVIRSTGVWAEGYWDREERKNLAPGRTLAAFTANGINVPEQSINQSRKTTSGGVVAGADISKFEIGQSISGVQVGVFSGYNSTVSKLSDITVQSQGFNIGTGLVDGLAITNISQDRQEVSGVFGGVYGSVVLGKFSADLSFKVDWFDVERRFVERFFFDPGCAPPGDIINTLTTRRDSTTMTNYTVATNANYRIDIGSGHYIEPTAGIRWTFSDFGNNAAALGLKDGDIFRVQGGLRLGSRSVSADGWVWNNSITGLLYSDVAINGYSTGAPGPGGLAALDPRIDEGKLRVMGILESRVDVGYGYTLYGIGEVRGGEDYIGYGLRGGVRYQW